jgi:hypothetical protein
VSNCINYAAKFYDAPSTGTLDASSMASVHSSSVPASLLYPATSATKMAASFRVSATAVVHPSDFASLLERAAAAGDERLSR